MVVCGGEEGVVEVMVCGGDMNWLAMRWCEVAGGGWWGDVKWWVCMGR